MNDADIVKAFDILDKFEFFGGQRAGRELWFDKPTDIQNEDIGDFLRDLDFLKQFIKYQQAEIEELTKLLRSRHLAIEHLEGVIVSLPDEVRDETIKEFADRLVSIYENDEIYAKPTAHTLVMTLFRNIDNLVKEMTEGNYER